MNFRLRPFVVTRSEPLNDCNLVFTRRQLSADRMIYRKWKPLQFVNLLKKSGFRDRNIVINLIPCWAAEMNILDTLVCH